jgi:coenzyme PQQ precursor peptide PqqA
MAQVTAFGVNPTLRSARIGPKETAMKWKTPVIIEIAVGLEINAYACAEVK